jgi:hypothetical protein
LIISVSAVMLRLRFAIEDLHAETALADDNDLLRLALRSLDIEHGAASFKPTATADFS